MKIDVFKISGNKNIGNLFLKYELLFFDQANSSSDLSQTSIPHLLICRASLPLSPSLSNFTLAYWNPLEHNPHQVLHWFLYFVHYIQSQATKNIEYTKPYAKRSQSILLSCYGLITDIDIHIMIPYGSKTLPIKKLSL